MRIIFAETSFWVALANPRDRWHRRARALRQSLRSARILTTEEVLGEVLTFFCAHGAYMRQRTVAAIRAVQQDPDVIVLPQTHESFQAGVALFEDRLDKVYSFIDCVSMHVLREHGVREVLTNDHHFEQEGFVILLHD